MDIRVLSSPVIGLCVFSACVLYMVIASFWTAKTHLSEFKGPWWAAYSRLWLFEALRSQRCNEIYMEASKRYGSLARVGPNHLITTDPEIFRNILGVRSKYERGSWFDCLLLDPYKANLITERNRLVHNSLRAKMANGVGRPSSVPHVCQHVVRS